MENKDTVRIRIVKCGSIAKWYFDRVGKEFDVWEDKNYPEWYFLFHDNNAILKSDCEIISPQPDIQTVKNQRHDRCRINNQNI